MNFDVKNSNHFESNEIRPDRKIRLALFIIAALLIAMGLVMIYSASAIYADQRYGDSMFFLKRHLLFLLLGFVVSFFCMVVSLEKIDAFAKPLFIFTCAVLVIVLLVADPIGGAKRWIRFGAFQIQPSEFAKLITIFYLAHVLSRKKAQLTYFKADVLPITIMIGTLCLLILMGKDFGTTFVILCVSAIMLLMAGIPTKYLIRLGLMVSPVLIMAIVFEPYRMKRIIAFMNPWQDIKSTGFQLYQSLLAIGSGGFTGVGLGHSQQKLFYLPAAHTDFIFSIIGEELGFVGAGAVILLYVAFGIVGYLIILKSHNFFYQFLSLGIVSLILLEAMINIGVSIGVMPTKGLALPLISYGGSSLVVKLAAMGILFNISKHSSQR